MSLIYLYESSSLDFHYLNRPKLNELILNFFSAILQNNLRLRSIDRFVDFRVRKIALILTCFWVNFSIAQNLTIEEAWTLKDENPTKSIKELKLSLQKYRASGNEELEAKTLSYIGVIEDIQGNSVKAIDHLLKAIKIQERNDFLQDLSFSYNNLGIAHFYQFNYTTALVYYKKSLAIDKKRNDLKGEAGTLINIGLIYTYIDSIPKAEKNYKEALKVYTKLEDSIGLASTLNNLAKIEIGNNNVRKAIEYYHASLAYLKTSSLIEAKFTPYYGLANAYLALKKPNEAIVFANEAVELAKSSNARERLQYGYEILAEAHKKSGNNELAYKNLKSYADLRDSLINEDRTNQIADMQTKYESEKKDKRIIEVELKNQQEKSKRILQEKETLEKQKTLNYVLFSLFSLIIILVIISYAYRIKQRNNNLLLERNQAIEDNLTQKETMIGEIHHRVKNNLQLISSILDLQARSLDNEEAKKAIHDSQNRVLTMAIIHQKLYQQDDIYGISMLEYISNISEAIIDSTTETTNSIKFNYAISPIQLHIDTSIPIGLIITEIITNAVKYAFPNAQSGEIFISLRENLNVLELIVRDNGVGMENAAESKNSTSFGLKMIKSLAHQLKAEWAVESENGTEFQFNIKNYKRSE